MINKISSEKELNWVFQVQWNLSEAIFTAVVTQKSLMIKGECLKLSNFFPLLLNL